MLHNFVYTYFPYKEGSDYDTVEKLHDQRLVVLNNKDGLWNAIKDNIETVKEKNEEAVIVITGIYDQYTLDKMKDMEKTVFYFDVPVEDRKEIFRKEFDHEGETVSRFSDEDVMSYISVLNQENGKCGYMPIDYTDKKVYVLDKDKDLGKLAFKLSVDI